MKQLLIYFFLSLSITISAQEICDDAIDNDGDGLIDLNDIDDCICVTEIPSGIIPNPSFEEYTICPFNEEQLRFAVGWEQASEATSDFIHTCGDFLGNTWANNAQAPQPFPDGDGCIGFRDGNTGRPNFKEYVGSKFNQRMTKGTTYRLDFFVGFHDHPSSLVFPMAVFLTDNANNLPFGGADASFGCPANDPNWDLAAELVVEGENEWVNIQMDFTPDKNYEAIVLGPGCDINPLWRDEPYFFMDRLALAEISEYSLPASIIGNICNDQLAIELQPDQIGYQWYFDGAALVDETSRILRLTGSSPEGKYIAVVETAEGCFFSDSYVLGFPPQEYFFDQSLCEGEILEFAGEEISVGGEYRDTVSVGLLCDSITILSVTVYPDEAGTEEITFCTGETVTYGGETYTQGGVYSPTLSTIYGCDSTVTLSLVEVDTAQIYQGPTIEICQGDTYLVNNIAVDLPGIYSDTTYLDSGCDSVSVLELLINQNTEGFITESLCPGEEVIINAISYTEGGQYEYALENQVGCDSTLYIDIIALPAVEQFSVEDSIFIRLGEKIDLIPTYGSDVAKVEWYDEDDLISDENNLLQYQPLSNSTYTLKVYNDSGCISERSIYVEVDGTIDIYIPDVFTPQSQTDNMFIIGTNDAVVDISDFKVYDRWGNLVFSYSGPADDFSGWDGRRGNSSYVEQGVYTYVAEFLILDESFAKRAGHLTVLR